MQTKILFFASLVMAWCSGAAAKAAEPTNATAIFDHYFAAAGGRPALEKVKTVAVTGTGREGQLSFKFELSLKPPGQILMVLSNETGLCIRMGRDKDAHCWRANNAGEGVQDLPDQDAVGLMSLSIGFFPPSQLFLSESLAKATFQKVITANTKTFLALGKDEKGPFPQLMFDSDSGLLARVSSVALEDYREVQGVKLPFVAKDKQCEFKVIKIAINPGLDDALFEKPKGNALASVSPLKFTYQTLRSAEGKLEIVRHPEPINFGRGALKQLPSYSADSSKHAQVDLRGFDLDKLDVTDRLADLLHADFDSKTRWPEKLPRGFSQKQILELGKDPGLRIRTLHKRGIRGTGIGIGIIDQTLLVNHAEYFSQIRLYEEIHNTTFNRSEMHGPAVASIAAGNTVGVAPGADLYYIAETHGTWGPNQSFNWDFTPLAQSIDRLLEINALLPPEKKIRVISVSVGWTPDQKGFNDVMDAVERATKQRVFVVSTAIDKTHNLAFHGLGREAMADPNQFESFGPGSWWAPGFWKGQQRFSPGERLLVPMDARSTASPTGLEDYVFYSSGGWSWSVPWIAGLYALACEVNPDITPELFWAQALKTGKNIKIHKNGGDYPFGTIVDPVKLIDSLSSGATSFKTPGV